MITIYKGKPSPARIRTSRAPETGRPAVFHQLWVWASSGSPTPRRFLVSVVENRKSGKFSKLMGMCDFWSY